MDMMAIDIMIIVCFEPWVKDSLSLDERLTHALLTNWRVMLEYITST